MARETIDGWEPKRAAANQNEPAEEGTPQPVDEATRRLMLDTLAALEQRQAVSPEAYQNTVPERALEEAARAQFLTESIRDSVSNRPAPANSIDRILREVAAEDVAAEQDNVESLEKARLEKLRREDNAA